MRTTMLLVGQLLAWQWTGPAAPRGMYQTPRTTQAGTLACTFVYDHATSTARTSCASQGRELWHRTEKDAFVADAALAIDGTTLYSARHSDIATGCTLHAIDALTGRERWSVSLVGLGPIGHSKYFNVVQLRVINARPVVFGWEAAGRYVETRDPVTGGMVAHRIVP